MDSPSPEWYAHPAVPESTRSSGRRPWDAPPSEHPGRGAAAATDLGGAQTWPTPSGSETISTTSNGFAAAAMVLGVIAFWFFPVVFGTVGIIVAGVALSKHEPKAPLGMTFAVAGTLLGMIIGVALGS